MKYFLTFTILLMVGCSGSPSFEAPAPSDVRSITVTLFNRTDGETDLVEFDVPPSFHASILGMLDGAKPDKKPMKWQSLGRVRIEGATETTNVSLFSTSSSLGAFRVNDSYYRGGSTAEFLQRIEAANKSQSEQGKAPGP